MSYTVYAKLPNGKILKYGIPLQTIPEINKAKAEMKADLEKAGIKAKVEVSIDAYATGGPTIKKPSVCTAKNLKGGMIDVKGDPYKYNYAAELQNARRFYKDAVVVVCYNKAELWGSRRDARNFYSEGIRYSEGAERDRYVNIICDLEDGRDVALDEWY